MSELTLTIIKLGFLAVLWLFVLSTVSAVRADLFGVRPAKASREERPVKPAKPPKPVRPRSGVPTKLVVTEGPDRGREVPLEALTTVVIGRDPAATLSLTDEYVSTRHARFVAQNGLWFVEDLGSTNGTVLAGQRVRTASPVGPKTPVRLGKTVVELRK